MIEDYFQSGPFRLYYRFYPVPGAQAVCITLHGHGEHSGRYEKFQKVLESENISYAVFDYRGQGRSEGTDVYVDSLEDYLQDLDAFVKHLGLKEKFILHGNSLGALVAVHWALRHSEKIRGMILSSPCLGLNIPAPLRALNSFLNRWVPKLVYKNPVYPPHLTHHKEEMLLYQKDPLIKRKISVRLVHEMLSYGDHLRGIERFDFPFPVYVLEAELEKVVDGGLGKIFFEKVCAPDKKYQMFPGFYHELFHELEQDKAYETLKSYLRLICQRMKR